MTTTPDTHRQPVSPLQRAPHTKKSVYHNANPTTNPPNHNIYCIRTYYILRIIRGNPSPYFNHYYPMGQPGRATQRRLLLPILYTIRVSTPLSRACIYPKYHRLPKFLDYAILKPTPNRLLIQRTPMVSVHNGLYSKNTPIRPTPLTTQGPRGSPNCRLHSPSCSTA